MKAEKLKEILIVHQISTHELGPTFIYGSCQISELASPGLPGLVPYRDRASSERIYWWCTYIEIELIFTFLDHHLSRAVTQKLVENDPPIVGGILVLLECFGF